MVMKVAGKITEARQKVMPASSLTLVHYDNVVCLLCPCAELQEAFMLFDYSKSGRISARDIGPVIRSVGLKPSQAEIRSIMADVQQSGMLDGSGTVWCLMIC